MLRCSALYLDFDGVVADSMSGKSEAFAEALAPLGIGAEDAARFYRSQAGIGRARIFALAAQKLLGRTIESDEEAGVAARFARLEREARPGIRLFEGVAEFLAREQARRRLALVTGTPSGVIGEALEALGIGGLFHAAYSTAPCWSKDRLIASDLASCGVAADAALFAGDSQADMAAAALVPIRFVGIGEADFFEAGRACLVLARLVDLEAHLGAP